MRMMAAMVVILAAATLALGDAAQQAKKDFEQLFGEQVQAARKTPATDDNLACAQRILEAARESTLSPELMTLLCDAAADLAGDAPGGQKLAAEALALLTRVVPGKADYAQRKSLDVAMKQYAAAAGQAKARQAAGVGGQGEPERRCRRGDGGSEVGRGDRLTDRGGHGGLVHSNEDQVG
ncbi:MAG: hypothetical protein NT031_19460 [Planctomycetota bacterium]|nr:hypothetical protein [Planctomycetota bacterium]